MRNATYPYAVRAKEGLHLSLDEMRAKVPSLFASHPHERCSDRYVHISSIDVMNNLMAEGFMPVEARQGRTRMEDRRSFTRHLVRFRKLGDTAARKVGDVSFEVLMRNAHDRTGAYIFNAGAFRLICTNGMAVDEGTVASVHVRHFGKESQILQEVVEGAHAVVKQAPVVLEAIKQWSGIKLNNDERMALAESARTARFADAEGNISTTVTAKQLLIPRRPADQGDDLWRTFNVIQENTTRGGLSSVIVDRNGRHRMSTTREVNGINQDLKLNRDLWALAKEMAESKQKH